MVPRTKFIDYDARREPKTCRYCVRCQKDIKGAARIVFIEVHPFAIHPDDVDSACPSVGTALIGNDCAKKIGLEFSIAEHA